MEDWKYINGYEGLYQVSNFGRIKSVDRYTTNGRHVKERIKQLIPDKDGYLKVCLSKNNKQKTFSVARLVGLHFVTGFNKSYQINHIDETRDNNHFENLEWVTSKQNINYGTRTGRASASRSNPILSFSKTGLCRPFSSLTEAHDKLGVSLGNISSVVNNKRSLAGGYKFYKKTLEVNI